jgi:probable phosphoglycerate mutase
MHEHATRLLAIRHGETAWNVDTRIQGQLDIPLNDTGRWQAERMAAALADEPLQAIYASDLGRAHDTALALGRATGLPVQLEPGLRERGFGVFEGRTFREIEAEWPEGSLRWRRRDPGFGPEGGETLEDFYERCIHTATRLARRHLGESIALVAHGGVLDCLYRAGARVGLQAPRTWQLHNTGINRLLYTAEGFTLVGWGDTLHLETGALDETT